LKPFHFPVEHLGTKGAAVTGADELGAVNKDRVPTFQQLPDVFGKGRKDRAQTAWEIIGRAVSHETRPIGQEHRKRTGGVAGRGDDLPGNTEILQAHLFRYQDVRLHRRKLKKMPPKSSPKR